MNKSIIVGLALVGILATGALAQEPEPAPATPATPATPALADLVYECPIGNVTFAHTTHQDHNPVCTDCHPEPFGMAKTEMGIELGHEACSKCHSAEGPGFDVLDEAKCISCHIMPE